MATTYKAVASQVLSTTAASITFSSIPGTYTDLVLKISARVDGLSNQYQMVFNSSTTGYSQTYMYVSTGTATGNRISSGAFTYLIEDSVNNSNDGSPYFNNSEIYIPNYTSTSSKQLNTFSVREQNTATISGSGINFKADLYASSAAITSIALTPITGNFVANSRFDLYGITHI